MLSIAIAARRASTVATAAAVASAVADIRRVGVVGLGLMGHGIVQTAAAAGYTVVAVDANAEAVKRGMDMMAKSLHTIASKAVAKKTMTETAATAMVAETTARVTTSTSREALASCDLVIEAVPETMDVKTPVYADLARVLRPDAIIATNTSGLPVGKLADITGRPATTVRALQPLRAAAVAVALALALGPRLLSPRVWLCAQIGLHYFNPVQLMALVEVVKLDTTPQSVVDAAFKFVKSVGKTPVLCRDTPGFVVNRLLVPYMAQAMKLVDDGVASFRDVDTAMKLGAGHPMGPFTLADYGACASVGVWACECGCAVSQALARSLAGWLRSGSGHDAQHPEQLEGPVPWGARLHRAQGAATDGGSGQAGPQDRRGLLQVEGQPGGGVSAVCRVALVSAHAGAAGGVRTCLLACCWAGQRPDSGRPHAPARSARP